MRHSSPEAQFPALFGKPRTRQPPTDFKPADLRLLQWCLRQAAQTRQTPSVRRPPARRG